MQALYNKLQNLPTASNETQSLRTTYDHVKSILRALELHEEPLNTNVFVKALVLKKFLIDILFNLLPDQAPDLPTIRTKLELFITMREDIQVGTASALDVTPDVSNSNPHATTAILLKTGEKPESKPQNTNKAGKKTPICAFCNRPHWSDKCRTYPSLEQRKAQLQDACSKCLGKHPTNDCRSKHTCYHCKVGNQHHTSVCPQQYASVSRTNTPKNGSALPSTKPPANNTGTPASMVSETKDTRTVEPLI